MNNEAWCTCKVVVLQIKTYCFLPFSLPLPSPSSFLKLLFIYRTAQAEAFSSHSDGFRARLDSHASLAQDYRISDFQSGTKFVLSLHDTRMNEASYRHENFVRNKKPERTHSRTTCTGTKCRFGIMLTNIEKYMEIGWTRFKIKVIPLSCE